MPSFPKYKKPLILWFSHKKFQIPRPEPRKKDYLLFASQEFFSSMIGSGTLTGHLNGSTSCEPGTGRAGITMVGRGNIPALK